MSVASIGDFPVENLPYGVFSVSGGDQRVGVAIEDQILDLSRVGEFGDLFTAGCLDRLLVAGPEIWADTRAAIREIVTSGRAEANLISMDQAEMHLPCRIGNYVDFFSSLEHATNAGKILRSGSEPLTPNWRYLPLGYHGRAGSVVVDGTPIRRPTGQRRGSHGPLFGPTTKLDFELEVGFITGQGPEIGTPLPIEEAERYIFGLVLVN
ncbi:MAG: fumarylacetoacetate hydrolase family protein, partial [Acidimicrobiia bacterium]